MPRQFIPDTFLNRAKGEVITQAEIIRLIGVGPSHARYSLEICRIAEQIMLYKKSRGEPCTVAQVKHDIRILTDIEASKHNAAANDQAIRKLRTSNRRLSEVKVANFNQVQRQEHDRRLSVSGARVALTSGSVVKKVAQLAPAGRITPGRESYRRQK